MNTDNLGVFVSEIHPDARRAHVVLSYSKKMPYLHWESSRNQSLMARLIDEESEQNRRARRDANRLDRLQRQEKRILLQKSTTRRSGVELNGSKRFYLPDRISDRTTVLSSRVRHPLGRYLLAAARLFEAMSLYPDKVILRKTLFQRPPLHPRRTLDQVQSRGFRSTTAQDRHQVLYQATAPWASDQHQHGYAHPGHDEESSECSICLAEIRKVPKLLMVDQLWLWVLDSSTLITAFPTQYGFRKNEPSDVHKAIRTRVSGVRQEPDRERV